MTARKTKATVGAPNGTTRIDDYIATLDSPLREVASEVRQVVDASLPDFPGNVWHGHPVWSASADPGTNLVCLLKAYPSYVTFGLWKGRAVVDPSGRLQAGTRQMATVKLRTVEDVDHPLFGDWLRQARALAVSLPEH